MYTISKEFNLCYGHRVWRQQLNKELSCNAACKCKHFHGHEGRILVYLQGETLDERGMFLDFNELTFFKKFVDDILDHKMILDINDPILIQMLHGIIADISDLSSSLEMHEEGYSTIQKSVYEQLPSHIYEMCEGLIFVNFVPTSENLSKWLYDIVQAKLKPFNVKVSRIQFFETPKSQSNYIA